MVKLVKHTGCKMLSILALLSIICSTTGAQQAIFTTTSGTINFKSEAPLELIHATSKELAGVIDLSKNNYSFKVNIRSFNGFNSPLQREHFNENYLETFKYPDASFKGKIIEDINLQADGIYQVRAKGIFTIHGVAQERIIKSTITVHGSEILLQSIFSVLLSDHNIPIPKVVNQKLSNEIKVDVNATLLPR